VARIPIKGNMFLRLFPTQEERWIQQAREGDTNALGRLYDKYFGPLYNFVFYRVDGNHAMAEDITQYVFLTMVKNLNTFNECRGNFYCWLCGIAKHRITDALRFQQKHESLDANPSEIESGGDEILSRMEQQLLPDEVLLSKELQACVAGILTGLPDHYRQALSAKYIEDLDVQAIARKMGISEKATESLLMRAKDAFRKEFQKGRDGQFVRP